MHWYTRIWKPAQLLEANVRRRMRANCVEKTQCCTDYPHPHHGSISTVLDFYVHLGSRKFVTAGHKDCFNLPRWPFLYNKQPARPHIASSILKTWKHHPAPQIPEGCGKHWETMVSPTNVWFSTSIVRSVCSTTSSLCYQMLISTMSAVQRARGLVDKFEELRSVVQSTPVYFMWMDIQICMYL